MELWISLLQVAASPDSEDAGEQAFVNGIAPAGSAREAEVAYRSALLELGWNLVAAENMERFSKRCAESRVDAELMEIASVAQATGLPHFGTFHTWVDDEQVH